MSDQGRLAFFERLRGAGRDPKGFRGVRRWVGFAVALLAGTFLVPLVWPATEPFVQRTTPALSLFWFLAAVGFWLRMQERSFAVAGGFVVLLYAATAWTPWAYGIEDFAILALLSSFAVFALAGFNLVFILEEVVFDAHRELHLVHPAWRALPSFVVLALSISLPLLQRGGILHAPALWITSIVWTFLLLGWWTFRAFNPIHDGPVLREIHLLVAGTLAATGAVDLARLLQTQTGVVPSLVMYLVLVGTWVYVSYTTLQRTHFLLRAADAAPWLCILLAASFALLHHASFHYEVEGAAGVTVLLQQRVAYLVVGIWAGIGFYVAHSLWRVLRWVRDDRRVAPRGRIMAGSMARVAEGILSTETRFERFAASLFQAMDHLLPGRHRRPVVRSPDWELEIEGRWLESDSEE